MKDEKGGRMDIREEIAKYLWEQDWSGFNWQGEVPSNKKYFDHANQILSLIDKQKDAEFVRLNKKLDELQTDYRLLSNRMAESVEARENKPINTRGE